MIVDCRPVRLAQALYQIDSAILACIAPNRGTTVLQMQAILFVCERWAREYRMIFNLKKCEIVEYEAVLTDRVREWDLKGTGG